MFMIYADHAATTKISETAKLAMLSAMEEDWYNPSSLYTPGQQASGTLMDARVRIARCLGCLPKEIYFTSGVLRLHIRQHTRHHSGSRLQRAALCVCNSEHGHTSSLSEMVSA